ncbi:hypothetical protein [Sebaldella sp. S0638]|uniref:hypothetical protein n=1 Tax=Sebaldella sp. S0638 TaxID=2957809 RepID=UPI0020A140AE|nr:hypothetical protein [Sebaldella sp. S0638]MCP1222906.1 hypothetical protein [Sebaldella sp. S0638]
MFNKIFPEQVSGETEILQSIEHVETAINKIGEGHYVKKENGVITIIPKGALNVLGMTHPIRNYKKVIFEPVKTGDYSTKLKYTVFRKLAKASTVIYIIFLLLDVALIAGTIYTTITFSELAPLLFAATAGWVLISGCAFIFDYFMLLSKGAVLRGFKKNILRRLAALCEASARAWQ